MINGKINKKIKERTKSKKIHFQHKRKNLLSKKNNIHKKKFKNNKSNKYKKIIIIFTLIFINILLYYIFSENDKEENYGLSLEQKMEDYKTKKFVLFAWRDCSHCGFFSFYIVNFGCANKFINRGYIPIIDLQYFRNSLNKGNLTISNPWELFFYQPNNYTLKEVKKYAKHFKYKTCSNPSFRPDEKKIYYRDNNISFWYNFAKKYYPIKKEIMNEAKIIMKKFFGKSKNILGVKIRGTDYYSRPKGHSIPARVEKIIPDVKEMDKNYKYDFIYLATEDERVKNKFIPEFENKVRYLEPDLKKEYVNDVEKNLDLVKNYILTIIILSKCLDFVGCRCCGATGAFIFSGGFRHSKVYNLGEYR